MGMSDFEGLPVTVCDLLRKSASDRNDENLHWKSIGRGWSEAPLHAKSGNRFFSRKSQKTAGNWWKSIKFIGFHQKKWQTVFVTRPKTTHRTSATIRRSDTSTRRPFLNRNTLGNGPFRSYQLFLNKRFFTVFKMLFFLFARPEIELVYGFS